MDYNDPYSVQVAALKEAKARVSAIEQRIALITANPPPPVVTQRDQREAILDILNKMRAVPGGSRDLDMAVIAIRALPH